MKGVFTVLGLCFCAGALCQSATKEADAKIAPVIQKIKSENQPAIEGRNAVRLNCVTSNNTPLLIVAGVECDLKKLSDLHPDDVECVNVIKGEEAIKKYGSKAVHGVIIVQLKLKAATIR